VDVGSDTARRLIFELGREIQQVRLDLGLSQSTVARAVGLSRSTISRIERGAVRGVSVWHLARILAILGHELSARSYPSGEPIRDAGQTRLLARLRARVHPAFEWRHELPVGGSDRRAWDGMLLLPPLKIAVEAETRPRDIQALERRLELKRRDGGIERLVLLLADTRHNRALLRLYGRELRVNYPVAAAEALAALARGEDPGANAIIVL
jgi:transcriptional regulator with XRE-family HTH domain